MGASGQAGVRDRFLLPRLIADELRLYSGLLGVEPVCATTASQVDLASESRRDAPA